MFPLVSVEECRLQRLKIIYWGTLTITSEGGLGSMQQVDFSNMERFTSLLPVAPILDWYWSSANIVIREDDNQQHLKKP